MPEKARNEQATDEDDLFDRLPVACVETDIDGVMQRANDEALALLGAPRGACVGKLLVSFVVRSDTKLLRGVTRPSDDAVARVAVRFRARHGRPTPRVDVMVRRVGNHRLLWVLVVGGPSAERPSVAQPVRVLYVEDDVDIREMLEEVLLTEGFTVRTAATVDEARAALAASSYDLVLANYQLPDGDGASFLESLRADEAHRHLPRVMITGHARARRPPGVAFWTKPLDPRDVGARLRALRGEVMGAVEPRPTAREG